DVHNPFIPLVEIYKQLPYCHFAASVRSETITPLRKQSLTHGAYHLHDALLDNPVHYGWDPQLSHPAIRLGDFLSPDRLWFVLPAPDLISDTVPVLFDIITMFFYCHPIYSSCTFTGTDSFVCGVHVVFGQYLFQQF